jgi:hypothetical protein
MAGDPSESFKYFYDLLVTPGSSSTVARDDLVIELTEEAPLVDVVRHIHDTIASNDTDGSNPGGILVKPDKYSVVIVVQLRPIVDAGVELATTPAAGSLKN